MRVEGVEGVRNIFEAVSREEDVEVGEYVITNRDTDLKPLRLILINNITSANFTITECDKSYTIIEWLDNNLDQVHIIHSWIRSSNFRLGRVDNGKIIPAMTDNQLLFYLRHMIYNIQEFGYLLQRAGEYYQGTDDERIFSHYQLMIEDLNDISNRIGLKFNFNRNHIIEEMSNRPDLIFLNSDY